MKLYPNAKVVLTVRDSPQAWYKSVYDTIYKISFLTAKFETRYCFLNSLFIMLAILKKMVKTRFLTVGWFDSATLISFDVYRTSLVTV